MTAGEPTASGLRRAAEAVLGYLAETDPLPPAACDAIIGFGVFDLALPRFCGELFIHGAGRRIILCGGIGAGTGNLGGPEADAWRAELRKSHPQIPDDEVLVENRSTNTAENITFTAELLKRADPAGGFGVGIHTAIIVASPSRLRRVRLTMAALQPAVHVVRQVPRFTFDAEQALYARHGIDYNDHLAGEIDRIVDYPKRGWVAAEPLPPEIARAHAVLHAAIDKPASDPSYPTLP
ncbi:MAG: YdcF family protein [Opitutaceae bacterium]|nr:YdcF family protein [Opitutaceae bacterium]